MQRISFFCCFVQAEQWLPVLLPRLSIVVRNRREDVAVLIFFAMYNKVICVTLHGLLWSVTHTQYAVRAFALYQTLLCRLMLSGCRAGCGGSIFSCVASGTAAAPFLILLLLSNLMERGLSAAIQLHIVRATPGAVNGGNSPKVVEVHQAVFRLVRRSFQLFGRRLCLCFCLL